MKSRVKPSKNGVQLLNLVKLSNDQTHPFNRVKFRFYKKNDQNHEPSTKTIVKSSKNPVKRFQQNS